MFDNGQSWEIFGYDTRQLGGHWIAAWRELLWADDSPLRKHLDDVVRVHHGSEILFYQAGEVAEATPSMCEAVLLPDDLMLARRLRLPLSAEAFLESALALEANANSPFGPEDTAYGWKLLGRDSSHLDVVLSIVSVSTVMTYLGKHYDVHDPTAREVWVKVQGVIVVIQGFGESTRHGKYRKRLVRSALGIGICALLILLTVAASTWSKRVELSEFEKIAEQMQMQAGEATRMRSSLAVANETVVAVNELMAAHPNPHIEIARLTALLDDDVYLRRFSISGREIRIEGLAVDAASVMQLLTDQAAYSAVTAPQAITRVARTGLEQFSLDIVLNVGASG